MKINFFNIEDKKLKKLIAKIFNNACKVLSQPKRLLSVELGFVGAEEIRTLNNSKRGVDKVTDVLSFPMLNLSCGQIITKKEFASEIDVEEKTVNLGSIIINPERASEQALVYGHSTQREICFLALHGLLHLLGFDHIEKQDEEIMMLIAEKILTKFNITRGEKQDV